MSDNPAARRSATGLPAIWSDALGRASVRSVQVLAVAALVWLIGWIVTRVPLVVIPVLLALILASAISPLVRWLTVRGWPRALATGASFVLVLAVVGGVLTGLVALVRRQAADLTARVTDGIDRLHEFLNNGPIPVSDQELNSTRTAVQKFFTTSNFGAEAFTGVRTAGEILAGIVLMAVILFFFLKDGEKIRSFLFGFLPPRHEAKAHRAAERSTVVLGGYVRGTALIAALDGLIVGIALVILRIPVAFPLAVFVFIGGFIPIIGATVAGLLAVLVALVSSGPVPALIVLIVLVGVNQLEHHVLQPALMGKVLHIHGLVILLALAAGTMLAGIIGAVLAVPLTAVAWAAIKTWSGRDDPLPQPIVAPMGEAPPPGMAPPNPISHG